MRADSRQGAGWDGRTDGHGWDGRTPAALPWPAAAVPVRRPPRPVPVPQPGIVAGDEVSNLSLTTNYICLAVFCAVFYCQSFQWKVLPQAFQPCCASCLKRKINKAYC